jgi:hypothetical protein
MLRPHVPVSALVGKDLEQVVFGGGWEAVISGEKPLPLACLAVTPAGFVMEVPALPEPKISVIEVSLYTRSRSAWCSFPSLCSCMHVRLQG